MARFDEEAFIEDWKKTAEEGGTLEDFLSLPRWQYMSPELAAVHASRTRKNVLSTLPKLKRRTKVVQDDNAKNIGAEDIIRAAVTTSSHEEAAKLLGIPKSVYGQKYRTVKLLFPEKLQQAAELMAKKLRTRGRLSRVEKGRGPTDEQFRDVWNRDYDDRNEAIKAIAMEFPDVVEWEMSDTDERNIERLRKGISNLAGEIMRRNGTDYLRAHFYDKGANAKIRRQARLAGDEIPDVLDDEPDVDVDDELAAGFSDEIVRKTEDDDGDWDIENVDTGVELEPEDVQAEPELELEDEPEPVAKRKEEVTAPTLTDHEQLIALIYNTSDDAKDALSKLKKLGYSFGKPAKQGSPELSPLQDFKAQINDLKAKGAKIK